MVGWTTSAAPSTHLGQDERFVTTTGLQLLHAGISPFWIWLEFPGLVQLGIPAASLRGFV